MKSATNANELIKVSRKNKKYRFDDEKMRHKREPKNKK